MIQHQPLQPEQEFVDAGGGREIEGERVAAPAEGKKTDAVAAHGLQHREEGSRAGVGAGLQDRAQPVVARFLGQQALELVEAATAIEAVPADDRIERVEELVQGYPAPAPGG